MKKGTYPVFLALLIASVILAVSSTPLAAAPQRGGTLNIGINTDITAIDPHTTTAAITASVMGHVYERLIGLGENLELVPVLAERWEISDDNLQITFYLRKGKLFHNGQEMTADDVKFTFDRIRTPEIKFGRKKDFADIDRIEVVDKYTVRFYMKKSNLSMLYSMAYLSPLVAVVCEDEVEKQGEKMTNPIGTGPYKFVEWKPDRHILLERFEKYVPQPGPKNGFGGERVAYLDKLKFIPITEESAATMALLNKEVDLLVYVPFGMVEQFKNNYAKKGIVLEEKTSPNWGEIQIHMQKPVVENLKFRQAMAYAIDRDIVLQAALKGHGTPHSSWVARKNAYYTPFHDKWYEKDTAKAKKLLKEAGYNGEEVNISVSKKYPMHFGIAVAVQSELQAVGINAKLKVMEWANLIKAMYGNDFEILICSHTARPDPVTAYFYMKLNGMEEKYPRMAQIKEEAAGTLDTQKRIALFEEAHQMCIDTVPSYVFYNQNIVQAWQDNVKGYTIWEAGMQRYWGVWKEK
ncbi:MAG: ABC transporter substrate-binding protein [Desulfobacteraceae bacterium]|nr:ABC transporter substrate-binding protein [Desulfobacteraceae bacterium]